MIYEAIDKYRFIDLLTEDPHANFSYEGASYLFDLLDDVGEDIEFDRVAIRSQWYEYNDLGDLEDDGLSPDDEGVTALENGRYLVERQ